MDYDSLCTSKYVKVRSFIPDKETSVTTDLRSFLVTTASGRCELLEDTNIPLSLLYLVFSTSPPQTVRKGL